MPLRAHDDHVVGGARLATVALAPGGQFATVADVAARLAARDTLGVAEFNAAMDLRAERYGTAGWTPSGPLDALFPGTYYLAEVDALHRRTYART